MMPKFSVIVPVYNSENTLKRCIDSILCQTINDFELVLIDDGSTDSSLSICEEYSHLSNVFVITQPNGGVSKARNTGILSSHGQWLCFVDSDDYLEESFLSSFDFINEDALYVQSYKMVGGETFIPCFPQTSSQDSMYCQLELNNIINSPWAKAFSSSIVKRYGLFFNESISYGEDHIFVLDYYSKVNQIHYINNHLYAYCSSNIESLTQRLIPVEVINKFMVLLEQKLTSLLDKRIISEDTFTHVLTFRAYHSAIRSVVSAASGKVRGLLYNQVRVIKGWKIDNNYLTNRQKIKLFIIKSFPVALISFTINAYQRNSNKKL